MKHKESEGEQINKDSGSPEHNKLDFENPPSARVFYTYDSFLMELKLQNDSYTHKTEKNKGKKKKDQEKISETEKWFNSVELSVAIADNQEKRDKILCQRYLHRLETIEIVDLEEQNKINPRFYKEELLQEIYLELDKDHKLDDKEKLGAFIIGVSAELPDPEDHISVAFKGDSSSGKDSICKTALKHLPAMDSLFLTRSTMATLEDEAHRVKRIAFSEINQHREKGANKDIVETFKALAEGGLSIQKKDPKTGYKSTRRIQVEQKSLFYGTTETQTDEELETRYVIIPVRGYPEKNKIVVDFTCDRAKSPEHYLDKSKNKNSWIATSIKNLDHKLQPIIPFTDVFKKEIEDGEKSAYLFDYNKERIKRDAKRLFSLTRAITWLYQKQRVQESKDNMRFVYAEPQDFILALKIYADFFNLTYSGLDHRLQAVIDCVSNNMGKHQETITSMTGRLNPYGEEYKNWVPRHIVQEQLGISSKNTIKKHIEKLRDMGLIEGHYNEQVTNKIYLLRPVKARVNEVSLPVSIPSIDTCLTRWLTRKNNNNIPIEYYNKITKGSTIKYLTDEKDKEQERTIPTTKNDTSRLTGQKIPHIHTNPENINPSFLEIEKDYQGRCGYCGLAQSWIRWRDSNGNHLCQSCYTEELAERVT